MTDREWLSYCLGVFATYNTQTSKEMADKLERHLMESITTHVKAPPNPKTCRHNEFSVQSQTGDKICLRCGADL